MKQIHNIFSKTKTKKENQCPNPKIPIIIDTREKQSLIAANLIEKKANIKFETLEIGDYLIQDTIIERKTYKDFIISIINKRLYTQLNEIKKYPKHFLILENFHYNYNDTHRWGNSASNYCSSWYYHGYWCSDFNYRTDEKKIITRANVILS